MYPLQILLSTPVLATLVTIPLVLIAAVQRLFGPDADYVEGFRHRWWLRLQELGSLFVGYTTAYSNPEEYVCSARRSPEALEPVLWKGLFHRNLLAALKYRFVGNSKEWSASSWVYRESFWADTQLHVTLFRRADGRTDCYVHLEASNIKHPLKHVRGKGQIPGDPNGTFRETLDAGDVDRFVDERCLP